MSRKRKPAKADGQQFIAITPKCIYCGKFTIVYLTREVAQKYFEWMKSKKHPLTDIFPDATTEFRDLLTTGIHPDCVNPHLPQKEETEEPEAP